MLRINTKKENHRVKFELGATLDKAKKSSDGQTLFIQGNFENSDIISTNYTNPRSSDSATVLNERDFNSASEFSLGDDIDKEASTKWQEDCAMTQTNHISRIEHLNKEFNPVKEVHDEEKNKRHQKEAQFLAAQMNAKISERAFQPKPSLMV